MQKPVQVAAKPRPRLRQLTGSEANRLETMVETIEDDGLREALSKLGRSVMGTKR